MNKIKNEKASRINGLKMKRKNVRNISISKINLGNSPKLAKLFDLAEPYLEKNDFGAGHTRRVLEIAKKHFQIPVEIKELVLAAIILHDVGGRSIREQYERGPRIAAELLKGLGYNEEFIEEVCRIIKRHHDRPKTPEELFKILYDSDHLVKFSKEEFEHYDSRQGFNWNTVIENLYHESSKILAIKLWKKRLTKAHNYQK